MSIPELKNIEYSTYNSARAYEKPDLAESIRMYVLLRADLPYIHQSVQAGHAVAKYLIEHDRKAVFNINVHSRRMRPWYEAYAVELASEQYEWKNGYMIYLQVPAEIDLIHWSKQLTEWGIANSVFEEPDWGTDTPVATALACIGFPGDFGNLKLANMPKGILTSVFKSDKLPY
jgi:hypothetical protein